MSCSLGSPLWALAGSEALPLAFFEAGLCASIRVAGGVRDEGHADVIDRKVDVEPVGPMLAWLLRWPGFAGVGVARGNGQRTSLCESWSAPRPSTEDGTGRLALAALVGQRH